MTASQSKLAVLLIGLGTVSGWLAGATAAQAQTALELANKGTAHAHAGDLDKAISAYTEAIHLCG